MAGTKTITWAGVSSDTIPELVIGQVTRSLIGSLRQSFLDIAGRDGSWVFPDKRGRRTITAECFVMAPDISSRRDVVTSVANWLDVEIQSKLAISDEPGVYYEAVLGEAPDVTEWREAGTFTLTWLVNPYSLDDSVDYSSVTLTPSGTHAWSPGLTVDVYPVIEITPTDGTIDGFTLTVDGNTLEYGGAIADDATVTINSVASIVLAGLNTDVELTGAYDTLAVSMADVSGKFPILKADSGSSLTFTSLGGTATSVDIVISYRKRYRK